MGMPLRVYLLVIWCPVFCLVLPFAIDGNLRIWMTALRKLCIRTSASAMRVLMATWA